MYISIQYKICTYCIVTYFSIMAEATINGLGIPTNGIAPIQHTHANQNHYLNVGGLDLNSDDEEEEEEDVDVQGELSSIGNDNTGYSSSSYGHTTREDDSSIGSIGSMSSMDTDLLAFASPIASPNVSINSIGVGGRRARFRSRSRSRSKTRRKSRAKRGNKTTRRRRRTKKNKKRKERNNNKKRVRFSTRPTQKNNKSLRIVKK